MKMILIGNYWLMILSWIMFLNGYELFAILVSLACLLVLKEFININYKRLVIYGVVIFCFLVMALNSSKLIIFFPYLSIHLLLVCLNSTLVYFGLKYMNNSFILPIISIIILSLIFITTLIIIIPDEYYSIIGKTNLILMELFIFVPYLLPAAICSVSLAHHKKRNTYIRNNELQL